LRPQAGTATDAQELRAESQLKHRGAEKPAKPRYKPRALAATAPGQLFSWDITYLPTLVMGIYFYLYLFMDTAARSSAGRSMNQKARGPAVPAMPLGSPGMEGPRKDPFDVLLVKADGSTSVYKHDN
jgi:transposase InsO family protein